MSIFTPPEKKAEKIRQLISCSDPSGDLKKVYFADHDSAMKSEALLQKYEQTSALKVALKHAPSFLEHLIVTCKMDAQNVHNSEKSLLFIALTSSNVMMGTLNSLMDYGVKLNDDESEILENLTRSSNIETKLIKRLITDGNADPNEPGFLRRITTEPRCAHLFQLAIDHGAKPELLPDQHNLILSALHEYASDAPAYYLINKQTQDENLQQLFNECLLTKKLSTSLYENFRKLGVKLEAFRDNENGTLLHFACRKDDISMFQDAMSLVKKGLIDINALNHNKENALNVTKGASSGFYAYAIEKMVMAGIDTSLADAKYGKTIMHSVIEYCKEDDICQNVLQMLIDKKIDINACNKQKETPLHLAAQSGRLNIVKLLVRNDANTSLENAKGQTALEAAQKIGHADVVRVLKGINVDQNWQLLDRNRIAHITIDAPIQKKITDIFNFAVQERITIIDDLNVTTSACMREQFDASLPAAISAFKRYKALNGPIDEAQAFGSIEKKSGAPLFNKGAS